MKCHSEEVGQRFGLSIEDVAYILFDLSLYLYFNGSKFRTSLFKLGMRRRTVRREINDREGEGEGGN